MGGMPLMVVARNLGHADTRMVERHYGHLAPSYVAEFGKEARAEVPQNVLQCEGVVMDWRGTFELVRERLRQCLKHAKKELGGRRQGLYPGVCLIGLPVAKLKSAFSDDSCKWHALIFRSDEEREAFISQRCHPEPELNGRPRGEAVRAAATMALYFYDAWRTENEERGIGGHRGEMKFLAAQAIVEDFFAWRFCKGVRPIFLWELGLPKSMDAFIGVVHGLMDKPKSRRQPKRGTCLEYLATGEGIHLPQKPPLN